MDEQVLAGFIGRDEAVALVVAEPFDGSGCHVFPPGRLRAAKRGRCESNHYERWHWFAGRNTRHAEVKRTRRGAGVRSRGFNSVSADPLCQAVLVGVAHGLGAVAGAGLVEDTVDVGLDGRVAEDQLVRALAVGESGGDQLEQLKYAR